MVFSMTRIAFSAGLSFVTGISKTGAARVVSQTARLFQHKLGGLISASRNWHIGDGARRPGLVDSENPHMHLNLGVAHLQPIVSLVAGVLILVRPKLLNYIVAIYLILSGIIGFGFVR